MMTQVKTLLQKHRKIVLATLLGVAVLLIYPKVSRSIRVRGYEKLLSTRGGDPDPILLTKLEEFIEKKDWSEGRLLADLLCPVLKEEAESLLQCGAVYLEVGEDERAREVVRRAKVIFRRNTGERVRIETKNPALFWKVGFLLRESDRRLVRFSARTDGGLRAVPFSPINIGRKGRGSELPSAPNSLPSTDLQGGFSGPGRHWAFGGRSPRVRHLRNVDPFVGLSRHHRFKRRH